MSRICIIGNSHVGAYKDALGDDPASRLPVGVEVTLFGSHRDTLANAEVTEDGILRSRNKRVKEMFAWTSGGQSEVLLRDYDAIYVVLGRSFFDIREFQAHRHGFSASVPPISDTVLRCIIEALFARWDIALARKIVEVPDAPRVVFLGAPFFSAEQPAANALLARLATDPDGIEARQINDINLALDTAARELSPAGLEICRPPAEALEPMGLFTQHSYAVGSQKLSNIDPGAHPTTDFGHMNGAYGAMVFEKIMGVTLSRSR